ncbi:RsbS, negative regulator of sigma-B [Vibrio cidicii]|uniref:RsbS, negative regulator of sigma-B n=1 Tax=Vibrio cidicii TaxID=1763883 RepID=A0A151KUS0_9VIBR|nr:STAS domain-containing protein [Vibrio cidicii]KYN85112.1 RsbS, negative regulator of sigma-B [Vibrio cidicii]KYN90832.1 RsbS, negative regulator of sigma-B [Vibrio cidicii]MBG0761382.1 RsbS, negative regulator of sigma-B [Vibrio cidicii]
MQSAIAISKLQDVLIASIQVDLTESVLRDFSLDLLDVLNSTRAKGVMIDLAGVKTLDVESVYQLLDVIKTVEVMGRRCLIAGLRPGVVIGLMDVGIDLTAIECVADLEQGLRSLA